MQELLSQGTTTNVTLSIILCSAVICLYPTGQPPNLVQLLQLDIPQLVGVKYQNFGVHLLEDSTGRRIDIIVHDHPQDAEAINVQILKDWIAGKGKPRTWKALLFALRDSRIVDWTNHLVPE